MKPRSTLILLGVGAALFAYIWFVEKNNKTTRETQESAGKVVQLDRDKDKIDSISIRGPETRIELRKKENSQWVMEDPVKDRADSTAVAELLTTVEGLRSDAAIDVDPKNKQQLKEYGVAESNTKVKFSGGGKTTEIMVGKDAAIEGKCYVYVEGAHKVHAVGNSLKNQLVKKADDYRDRKLAEITTQQVTKAEIKSGAGLIELTKTNNHW